MLTLFLLLTLTLRFHGSEAEAPPLSSYFFNATLQAGDLYMYWSVNESTGNLHVALHARTSGWVALGISEVGAMVGSDVIFGWVSSGDAVITDRFAFNKSLDASGVVLDAQQDVQIVAGKEALDASTGDVWTTLHFRRALNTSDCNDRAIAPGEHVSLIWAMGTTDSPGYHGLSRGGTSLVLRPRLLFSTYGPQPSSGPSSAKVGRAAEGSVVHRKVRSSARATTQPAAGSGEQTLNLTFRNYRVPVNYTTYTCTNFNLDFTSKHHAIEWGVIVNSSHPETLHHAVVTGCKDTGKQPPDLPAYDCIDGVVEACTTYIALWAIGGIPYKLPDVAGLPLGPGGFKKLILQMHYTNPGGLENVVDNSGIYFRVTTQLRKHDALITAVGPVDFHDLIKIPPQQPSWALDNVCPGECTRALLEGSNFTVLGSFLHQHAIGRQVYTELYRRGRKLLTIARQDYYDFAYQQFKDLSPGVTILPGDELRTRCVWDSTTRKEVTPGGPSSNEEMCMTYLLYFPAETLELGSGCFSMCFPPTHGDSNSTQPWTTLAVCSETLFLPLHSTCDPATRFGATAEFATIAGCNSSVTTLSAALNTSITTVPADAVPSAPTAAACSAVGPSGEAEMYAHCVALEGGFDLMWNHTDAAADGNVTLDLLFSGASTGYIAFGFSPEGRMIGSSVFAGWQATSAPYSSQPTETVQPLYLGGYAPSLIARENSITLLRSQMLTNALGRTAIRVSISLKQSTATANQTIVWAKGQVINNFVSQHLASDAHIKSLLLVDSSPIPRSGEGKSARRRLLGGTWGFLIGSLALCLLVV